VVDNRDSFTFDNVFPENSTQEEVFNTAAIPVVDDMLAGYNCTLFVYGQSGSGKTFSMAGAPENPGLTPRIVEKIFNHIYTSDDDCEFTVSISYIEIYLEKIRDLLNPVEENLPLRESGEGFFIDKVTEEYESCYEDVISLFDVGNGNRSVGETKMNQKSSRSHSVFFLTLSQTHQTEKITSKLVLVDLAGSEKVSKTGASGLLLKQAQHTNQSLTSLGIVIRALIDKSSHIPYRNSKLTRLLADSLGGNSKTCLIVTCSPSSYNLDETISTLRFGTDVKTVKNKPQVNVEKKEMNGELIQAQKRIKELESSVGDNKELERLTLEIDNLRSELEAKNVEIEILTKTLENERRVLAEKETRADVRRASFTWSLVDDVKESGPSRQYYQRLLESRQEMINILEIALRNAEEILKAHRNDYDRLRRQNEELRSKGNSPRKVIPVKRLKRF
jgi:kinesin family protein 5